MTNRREFIQTGVAAAAVATPTLSALAATPASAAVPSLPLYKVAFDRRHSASMIFGAEARRLGADIHDINGDITGLWYGDLYHRWRQSPVAVAGMTTFSALLGLEMMANAAGLRTIYRAHHHVGDNGAAAHDVFGPLQAQARGIELRSAKTDWASTAANIVMTLPADSATIAKPRSNIADASRNAVALEAMISWIIAPLHRG